MGSCFRKEMIKLLHRTWPLCQQATTDLTKITKTNRIPMYAWVADSQKPRSCSFFTTMTKKRATKIKTKKTGARSKTTGRGTTVPIPGRTTRNRRGQKKWSKFNNNPETPITVVDRSPPQGCGVHASLGGVETAQYSRYCTHRAAIH